MSSITLSTTKDISIEQILPIYKANEWSSAEKPEELFKALTNSHNLVTAWEGDTLVGLANAISDGYLVVYYPHILVHPDHQGKGIGRLLVEKLMELYEGFHMQSLTAKSKAVNFYLKLGFDKADETESMWIYKGDQNNED